MADKVVSPSLEDLIAQHAAARDLLDIARKEHAAAWRVWDDTGARLSDRHKAVDKVERAILAHISDPDPEGLESPAVYLGREVSS